MPFSVPMDSWKQHVRTAVTEIEAKFPASSCGTYPGHDPALNRAADFMIPNFLTATGIDLGDRMAKYLQANAKRLNVWYIIWRGRTWSRTRPAAGWQPYYARNAVRADGSPDHSKRHTNHVHVSFYDVDTPDPVKHLPPYLVNPAKVETTLVGNNLRGEKDVERPPLFRITTGVTLRDGWLITEAGYSYNLAYLIPEADYKAAQKAAKPKPVTCRVATLNVLSVAAEKPGDLPFTERLDRLVTAIRSSRATVILAQECNADRAADIQGALGADWVWSRVHARTILVDTRTWDMGAERKRTLPTPHSKSDKSWPLVELKHKQSGETIWAASVHMTSTSAYAAVATKEQIEEERRLQAVALTEALKPYRWIVLGGDFNSASLNEGRPKRVLSDAGWSLLTQHPKFASADVDSFTNTAPGGQQIDEVATKAGLTILSGEIVDTAGGSDHQLMVAELQVVPRKAST